MIAHFLPLQQERAFSPSSLSFLSHYFHFVSFYSGKGSQMINPLLFLYSAINILLSASKEDVNPTSAFFGPLLSCPLPQALYGCCQNCGFWPIEDNCFSKIFFWFIVKKKKNSVLPFLVFRIICSIIFITPMLFFSFCTIFRQKQRATQTLHFPTDRMFNWPSALLTELLQLL